MHKYRRYSSTIDNLTRLSQIKSLLSLTNINPLEDIIVDN